MKLRLGAIIAKSFGAKSLGIKSYARQRSLSRPLARRAPPKRQSGGAAPRTTRSPRRSPRASETLLPALAQRASGSSAILRARDFISEGSKLRSSVESFLSDQRSVHTKRAYARDLKRFFQFFSVEEKRNQGVIDRALLVKYKNQLLAESLEHTTIDRHLSTLRSFFAWLVADGLIDRSPAEGIKFLNPVRLSKTEGFSNEEVLRILRLPDRHTRTGSQHGAILAMLFFCGLRRSELCELKLAHLAKERGHSVIRLRGGKGNRERIVVIPPAANQELEHYLAITQRRRKIDARDTALEPLFTAVRARMGRMSLRPLDSSTIFYIVRKYAKLAGIERRVSPHSCRATAISNARDRSVSDRAIQEFAGWTSTSMITNYDKRRTAVEQAAALAIDYE
jgi:site-specific recombinase XerD